LLESNGQIADMDRLEQHIGMDDNTSGDGFAWTEIIGGRHPVDKYAGFLAACDSLNDSPIVNRGRLAGQTIYARPVIEPGVYATNFPNCLQALERLANCITRCEIWKSPTVQTAEGVPADILPKTLDSKDEFMPIIAILHREYVYTFETTINREGKIE
jgi:hypothetical protein